MPIARQSRAIKPDPLPMATDRAWFFGFCFYFGGFDYGGCFYDYFCIVDSWRSRKGSIDMTQAPIKWIATSSGDHRELILADSPSEARRIFEEIHAEPPTAVRLHSGFPKLSEDDLIFGETVFPRDCFPAHDSDALVQVNNAQQLDNYLRSVLVGVEFTPPLRIHTTSHGTWKVPEFDEGRKRFAASKLEAIERDRLAGLSCE